MNTIESNNFAFYENFSFTRCWLFERTKEKEKEQEKVKWKFFIIVLRKYSLCIREEKSTCDLGLLHHFTWLSQKHWINISRFLFPEICDFFKFCQINNLIIFTSELAFLKEKNKIKEYIYMKKKKVECIIVVFGMKNSFLLWINDRYCFDIVRYNYSYDRYLYDLLLFM